MYVDERTVALVGTDDMAQPSEVGWFAAKQPGLLRYLEDRLGPATDAFAMSVDLCWRIVAAFERQRGLPLPRIYLEELERAEVEVVGESQTELNLATSCAHRQPELCQWLARMLASPVLPLDRIALDQIALSCATCISACDRAHTPEATDDLATGTIIG